MRQPDLECVSECILYMASEIRRLRVESKELRAQIEALRGQYEKHTHSVYEEFMFGGECITWKSGPPND